MTKRPALFLDRDGVINREVDYLWKPEDCVLIDGIIPLLQTAHELGYFVAVITNQAGIGRGYYSEADFHTLMDHIAAELAPHGAHFDAIYFSPFHPVHGIGHYQQDTDCRKPGPGMILRAAAEHNLNLRESIFIGDRCTDMEAAAAAGVPDRYLFGSTEIAPCSSGVSYTAVNKLSLVSGHMHQRSSVPLS